MNSIAAPAKPGLSARQKELLGRRLEAERRDAYFSIDLLASEIDSVTSSRSATATDDEHDPEGATLAFEQSQSSALLGQASARLAQIDEALARLDAGTYGVCAHCGSAISYARLGARPYTPHCLACAEKLGV